MFGLADIVVISAMDRALAHLRKNPSHLEFILSAFASPDIVKYFGHEYIKNCVDYINNNKIFIKPYLFPDMNQIPSFVVGATYSESSQYIGQESVDFTKRQCPKVYAEFDVQNYDKSWVFLDDSEQIETKVWVGMLLTVGSFSAKIKSVMVRPGDTTIVELDTEVPVGTPFRGWKAQMYTNDKYFKCGSSMERANVQCKLTTSGDIATHRMMATIFRYAFKHERIYMDSMGLQNTVISQSMPTVTDDENPIYESLFTMEGDLHDFWIENELSMPDHFGLEVIGKSDNPTDEDVTLITD